MELVSKRKKLDLIKNEIFLVYFIKLNSGNLLENHNAVLKMSPKILEEFMRKKNYQRILFNTLRRIK